MEDVEIYLVPGFMGFDAIAGLHYFEGVEEVLRPALAEQGLRAHVHCTKTVPAGALSKRAAKLAREIASHHRESCGSVHLLGHSTGGLDIRLLLSPGGAFDVGGAETSELGSKETIALYEHALRNTRSAMSLATPHYGTPAANALLKIGFDRLLYELSSAAENGFTREAIVGALRFGGVAARFLRELHLEPEFLAWIEAVILDRSPESVPAYLASLGEDFGALRNLTQEAASLFNAAVERREGVDYVSYCTGTNEPHGPIESDDPFVRVNTAIFRKLWPSVAAANSAYPYAPKAAFAAAIAQYEADVASGRDVGELTLGVRTNDGVVPTLSQVFGRVGAVFASDHLDCVGMYQHDQTSGWIRSGAHFDRARFRLLWSRVAETVVKNHGKPVRDGTERAVGTA